MEKKLLDYRACRRGKDKMSTDVSFPDTVSLKKDCNTSSEKYNECSAASSGATLLPYQRLPLLENGQNAVEDNPLKLSWLTATLYVLYILLWLTLYAIAIHLEFGAVYFIISILYIVWMNTRTGPKKKGEISAYSVFNPNCASIDGTLKAEQFEQEIRFGAGSVH